MSDIRSYEQCYNILETYNITMDLGDWYSRNDGKFLGIASGDNDIYGLEVMYK